ncbi:MAG: TIGR01777 family oxidoreductase [Actinomycetota bacterium]|nr:TIGR01777 family oxidoreductase [Actinomycetota bacterium]
MDVAVTGASGFIGTALVGALTDAGHQVRRLVRRPPSAPDEVRWDPEAGTIDATGLAGVDAVVNLAGEGIASQRWTDEQKRRIRESRTASTRLIAETVAGLDPHPAVLLSGSAIGYYGHRGDEELTEASPPGTDFLAGVCVDWEAAVQPAVDAGVRTACLRTGIVLDPHGGALARMLPLFRLGVGGPFGRGHQWWSWISLADEVGAILHLLSAGVAGAVNLTAPQPEPNAELTRTLGRVLSRPALVPIPRIGPSVLLGSELSQSLLYDSIRVVPAALTESGYTFRHPDLETALRAMLDKPGG